MRKSNTGHKGVSFMASRSGDTHAARFFVDVKGHKRSYSCRKHGVTGAAAKAIFAAGYLAGRFEVTPVGGLVVKGSQVRVSRAVSPEADALALRVIEFV